MLQPTVSRYVRSVRYNDMPTLLKDFRVTLEKESGESVTDLTLCAGLLIHDLAVFLGLSDKDMQKILGTSAQVINDMINTPIKIKH